jgi:thymidylate synthase (FAD)
MEFIEPWWWRQFGPSGVDSLCFTEACIAGERLYNEMVSGGCQPQQARAVLPNALKTEIIVTADSAEWAHIKKLRTHPSAHPDMVRVMNMMPWEEIGI